MLNERLEKDHREEFVRVSFNPQTYRGESNLLILLLHTLRDSLEQDPQKHFLESAKKIGDILLRLGAGIVLKTVTADAVLLVKSNQPNWRFPT